MNRILPPTSSSAMWVFAEDRQQRLAKAVATSERRWMALVLSMVAHGLALAVLFYGGAQLLPAGSVVQNEESRVQLRFVSATIQVEEEGAMAANRSESVTRQAPVAAPAVTPAVNALDRSRIPQVEPEDVSRSEPAVAEHAVMPEPDAGQALAQSEAPVHEDHGAGQGGHGHGHHGRSGAPLVLTSGEMDWAQSVMRRLERFRTYPAAARQRRQQGIVVVQATIAADGQVLATRLQRSCGNADLDAEALATFTRAGRLPAPPSHLPSPLSVDLPVSFTLRG